MPDKPILLTGSCQCGAVTYTSTHLPTHFTSCHCSTCRKLSGAPFLTFGDFPIESISFTGTLPKRKTYSDVAVRSHCPECGSPIGMQYNCEPEWMSITAGTIDEKSVSGGLPGIQQNIFLEEGAGWYKLPEDNKVGKHETFPCAFQMKIDAWKVSTAPGLG